MNRTKTKRDDENVNISIKAPTSLKKWLKAEAQNDRRSMSNFILNILEEYYKKNK